MPVPVPHLSKPIAHPVKKQSQPSWSAWHRASHIWHTDQGFNNGLTAVAETRLDNVIKGERAQACIPPLFAFLNIEQALETRDQDMQSPDEDVGEDMDQMYDNESQWSASSPLPQDAVQPSEDIWLEPTHDDSAPLEETETLTPFGEFIDKAVGSVENAPIDEQEPELAQAQLPPTVVTPSASTAYKKLAGPLAEWVSLYVWKACTTGMSLPGKFTTTHIGKSYSATPPPHLAEAVHSLLLSTLLQPSAVLLAVWYIVRLPIYFNFDVNGETSLDPRELKFVLELLGNANEEEISRERFGEVLEAGAPFKLILLGCMLANKWLDDHTFSNKTWQTISNVHITTINRLESLTLAIFTYDLSITLTSWSAWLSHLQAYHANLLPSSPTGSPQRPGPIARPGASPHGVIKMALEDIIKAGGGDVEPVFLGIDERKKERREKDGALVPVIPGVTVQVNPNTVLDNHLPGETENHMEVEHGYESEIDLDEDGPLREEYLPKRRTSQRKEPPPYLPPPAKWSPAGDEPIFNRARMSLNAAGTIQKGLSLCGVGPPPPPINCHPVGPISAPAYREYYDYHAPPISYNIGMGQVYPTWLSHSVPQPPPPPYVPHSVHAPPKVFMWDNQYSMAHPPPPPQPPYPGYALHIPPHQSAPAPGQPHGRAHSMSFSFSQGYNGSQYTQMVSQQQQQHQTRPRHHSEANVHMPYAGYNNRCSGEWASNRIPEHYSMYGHAGYGHQQHLQAGAGIEPQACAQRYPFAPHPGVNYQAGWLRT